MYEEMVGFKGAKKYQLVMLGFIGFNSFTMFSLLIMFSKSRHTEEGALPAEAQEAMDKMYDAQINMAAGMRRDEEVMKMGNREKWRKPGFGKTPN
jgi:hypothetical protein